MPHCHPPPPPASSSRPRSASKLVAMSVNTIATPLMPPASSPRRVSSLSPVPVQPRWDDGAFSLSLAFTGALGSPVAMHDSLEASAPPAFFPLQRIGFLPTLRVGEAGIPMSMLGSMTLGVTGTVSVPVLDRKTGAAAVGSDGTPAWRTQRVLVDFITDLSSGLDIWRHDAEVACSATPRGWLPPGTYLLPLSMRIPCSDKLPPSFTATHFQVSYTMSLALCSAENDTRGTPLHSKVFSAPFEVLPSTLPCGPPSLPTLVFEGKRDIGLGGVWEGLKRAVTGSGAATRPKSADSASTRRTRRTVVSPAGRIAPTTPVSPKSRAPSASRSTTSRTERLTPTAPSNQSWTHLIKPHLPSSSFSPSASAVIPVTLSIVDKPGVPTDLYVRISLVRTLYVRDRGCSVATEATHSLIEDDLIMQSYVKEENEIVSRWGYIPYAGRPHATPDKECEVLIRDIGLPLFSTDPDEVDCWPHGYSTSLNLDPSAPPSLIPGVSSWFSPALRHRPPVASEYNRFLYVACRYSVVVEVGFAKAASSDESGQSPLEKCLGEIQSRLGPDFEVPPPHTFTKARGPSYTSTNLNNPFAVTEDSWSSLFINPRPGSSPTPNSSPRPVQSSQFSSSAPNSSFLQAPPLLSSSSMTSLPSSSSSTRSTSLPQFPGKMRTLRCPIVIGSVAEPTLECLSHHQSCIPEHTTPPTPAATLPFSTVSTSTPGQVNELNDIVIPSPETPPQRNELNSVTVNMIVDHTTLPSRSLLAPSLPMTTTPNRSRTPSPPSPISPSSSSSTSPSSSPQSQRRRRRRHQHGAGSHYRSLFHNGQADGDPWICPPPDYKTALKFVPAYYI